MIILLGISINKVYYPHKGYPNRVKRIIIPKHIETAVIDLNAAFGWGYMMITAYLKQRGENVSFRMVKNFMSEKGLMGRKVQRSDYSFNHKKIEADTPRYIFQTDFVRLYINGTWVYVFKVIDIFNREVVAFESSLFSGSVTSIKVLKSLKEVCVSFPVKLIQDNGSCYIASSYKDLAKGLNVQLEYIKAHTPEHNGVIERSFKTDKYEGLASFYLTLDNVHDILAEWFFFYNTQRPHSTNGYKTPLEKLNLYLEKHPDISLKPNPVNAIPNSIQYVSIPVKLLSVSP